MANELTLNTTSFVLQVGTKKAPQNFIAPRIGVALTGGKAGREAKSAEKADLPTQAANGGFHTFAGFLAATFPRAAAQYASRLAEQRTVYAKMLDGEENEAIAAHMAAKIDELDRASVPTNRAGFSVLVQTILNWADQGATKPPKLTKAQAEGMELVNRYVALMAERAAKRTDPVASEE